MSVPPGEGWWGRCRRRGDARGRASVAREGVRRREGGTRRRGPVASSFTARRRRRADRRLLEGLNRGLDRVEAALQGVDGSGGAPPRRWAGWRAASEPWRAASAPGIGRPVVQPVFQPVDQAFRPTPARTIRTIRINPRFIATPAKPGPSPGAHPSRGVEQAGGAEAAAARARAELNAGIRLLHRSAGAICADARSSLGARARRRPRTGARWRRRAHAAGAGARREEGWGLFPTPPRGFNDEG